MKKLIIKGITVLIDYEIYEKYKEVPFYISKTAKGKQYIRTSRKLINNTSTYLHHLVKGLPISKDWHIHFKDGNSFNCTKDNLEYLRHSEKTQRNSKIQKGRIKSSQYLGVTHIPAFCMARIKYDKKTIHLGSFKTEKEAAIAYNIKAKQLFGNKAKLNIIKDLSNILDKNKRLIDYIYEFAAIYGQYYHAKDFDAIMDNVSQKIDIPEEFIKKLGY